MTISVTVMISDKRDNRVPLLRPKADRSFCSRASLRLRRCKATTPTNMATSTASTTATAMVDELELELLVDLSVLPASTKTVLVTI